VSAGERAPLRDRSFYAVWREVSTRWSDNDAYGHANNVVYYEWFDSAVNAWLIENRLLDVIAGDPIGLVVETGCRFASPLAFPQPVEVGLAVERIGNSSVRYVLGIFAENESEASAEGHFIHVYVDRASRTPVPLPDAWRKKLETLVLAQSSSRTCLP
jgi:acyl-CoA thioester hydrolase